MVGNIISDFTNRLDDWSANWWFLAVVFGIALLDSILPVVPSELTVIVAGVAVATGNADYALWAVIVAGSTGAFIGDNLAYAIGHHWGKWFHRRAEHHPKFREKLEWADAQIRKRGGPLLITARFIPGGRTALTLSSGITRQRRWWFVRWVALATTLWASYAAGLAFVVGKPFEDNHNLAFWIAFATALVINVVLEIWRYRREKRRERAEQAAVAQA